MAVNRMEARPSTQEILTTFFKNLSESGEIQTTIDKKVLTVHTTDSSAHVILKKLRMMGFTPEVDNGVITVPLRGQQDELTALLRKLNEKPFDIKLAGDQALKVIQNYDEMMGHKPAASER